jgi:hypothetical protein
VLSITPAGNQRVAVTSELGMTIDAPVDWSFVL